MDPKPNYSSNGDVNCESPEKDAPTPVIAAAPSFRQQWKNPEYRKKFCLSMFMGLIFVALGLYSGQHGATFLDLQQVTHTDLESSSLYFTGGSVGSILGAIINGLIFDKIGSGLHFLLFLLPLLLGLTNIAIPYCRWFELMIFIRIMASMFTAAIKAGCHAEHMRIWRSKAAGLMQFLQFSFAAGAVISPLIAGPFLAEKATLEPHDSMENGTLLHHLNTSHSTDTVPPPETRVHTSYLIIGVFITLTSIPFLIVYFQNRNKMDAKQKVEQAKEKVSQRDIPTTTLVILLVNVGGFFSAYGCVEFTFFSYLMTFLVEEFSSVSKAKGAFIMSVVFAAFAVARFLMIFMARLLSPIHLLFLMTTTMAVAFACFTAFAHHGFVDALFFFSALAAFGMSGVYGSGFSWMESEMFRVTGVISSYIMIVSAAGSIINPTIIGYLMDNVDRMWFCYLLLIETTGMYVALFVSIVFTRCYVNRKYGKMDASSGKMAEVSLSNSKQSNTDTGDIKYLGEGKPLFVEENDDETKNCS